MKVIIQWVLIAAAVAAVIWGITDLSGLTFAKFFAGVVLFFVAVAIESK